MPELKPPDDLELLRKLSHDERFVLKWLAKEDFSVYGECKGPAFDKLKMLKLARINADKPSDFSAVTCTARGYAVAKLIGGDT